MLVVAVGALLMGCDTTITDGPEQQPDVALELVDGQWVSTDAYTEGTAGYSLQQIRNAFDRQDYGSAVSLTKKHVRAFRGDPTSEEAYFIAAQSELGRKNYYKAFDWFERQLKEYPGGEYFQAGLEGEYECAQAFMRGDRKLFGGPMTVKAEEEAIMIFNKIAAHAPGSAIAEKVIMEAAEFHYADGDYTQAADAYDYFVRMFPKSPQAAHAMLRSADSTYRLYYGPEYDATPLFEARQKYESFAEQFPRHAKDMQVEAILEDIYNAEAQREYETALFYDRTHKRTAAIHSYETVVEDYPGTIWAGRAEIALLSKGIEVDPDAEPERAPRRIVVPDDADDTPMIRPGDTEVASRDTTEPYRPPRRDVDVPREPTNTSIRRETDTGPFGPAGVDTQQPTRPER